MAQSQITPIFCNSIGNTTAAALQCCHPNNQTSSICQVDFDPNGPTFLGGCSSGDCIAECQDIGLLYSSVAQIDPYFGNGKAPIRRYQTCANVPAMAGYLSHNALEPSISSSVLPFVSPHTTDDDLRKVTRAITECLTSTCENARNRSICSSQCSAVNLLINSTTPNVEGLNDCLGSLCNGHYGSLPFADADVIGIGVFTSYIMQCIFVVLFWFGLLAFEIYRRKQKPAEQRVETRKTEETKGVQPQKQRTSNHQGLFEGFLVEFHKSQCYFSATIQIASLSYGIFETDMLVTFMLIPLATNGVLPVMFAFILLFRYGKATMDVTLLTAACWFLSSIVYWILYAHIIPINSDIGPGEREFRAYRQFMYKLSAIDACGGYSALAVCPDKFTVGQRDITKASHNIRVLTPIIWSFSTVCLIAVLAAKTARWVRGRNNRRQGSQEDPDNAAQDNPSSRNLPLTLSITYWLTTLCFVAGICMQLSLLSIGTSLNMMDGKDWGFGQIVAITIWVPPLMAYLYKEMKEVLRVRYHVGLSTLGGPSAVH
ncbi:hypothetical protein K505DRAFT_266015 [Melanomma pulvis-pyrius CBS 109.77]|uniref:Uncharacterized protein n=1 Tax=Melanomma pulvis-pyrius CBS 109.77 TaxID=1314802 RepID=A0A6A6XS25_9PLEO|nr:hypothetical protein K505DRAFT_266015 [Melanomma pulvis-pyrius CBS 109.77]